MQAQANTKPQFDRAADDVGNVIALEHVNLTVPDQQIAALFYVSGLGGTRDPYVDFGTFNMWVNVGEQQFHLPRGVPQKWRGHIGVVVPSLQQLRERLDRIARGLKDTRFGYQEFDDRLEVTCPWGNQFRCFAPGASDMSLGIAYVEMNVPTGTAPAIARFYQRVLGAPARLNGGVAEVSMGCRQCVRFRETAADIADYDGHHIAIYVASFSPPHAWLVANNLITEESDAHQYRFTAIVDPDTGTRVADLEHEVRSLHHPMFNRPLVNRNAAQGFANFRRGREAFVP